ncbi:MAG: alcohol dehydrogenase catalytic domain-containing protein [Rhodothermales bacterium]
METLEHNTIQSNGKTIDAYAAMDRGAVLKPYQYTPKELGPMDVEIDITHCGMCHTDLHLINDDFGLSTYPLVPGHEVVGTISQTGSHSAGEWARDDDGDGIREVHVNTVEGLWTTVRNFLRPFRGVHKKHLAGYVAICEFMVNLKRITPAFVSALVRTHHF